MNYYIKKQGYVDKKVYKKIKKEVKNRVCIKNSIIFAKNI